jgi:hypothetical protein
MNLDAIPLAPNSSYVAEGVMSFGEFMPGSSVTATNIRITTDRSGGVAAFSDGNDASTAEHADMWDYRKLRNVATGEVWDLRLHTAVVIDSLALAKEAIADGADVHLRIKQSSTPLHWAAAMGCRPIAELLIRQGADANATDDLGWVPSALADAQGYPSLAEYLRGQETNQT